MEFRITIQNEIDGDALIEPFMDEVAESVPVAFRSGVDSEPARGILYKRGNITARRTKRGVAAGFKAVKKTRMNVGSRFHRASAPGQFPARDSNRLYNKIRIVKKGLDRQVIFDAPHAGFAEEQRPFLSKTIDLVIQRFI